MNSSVTSLSVEKVYLRRTFLEKSGNEVCRFWIGRGFCGMNLCPRPSSCLVPVGGECSLHKSWKVRLEMVLKYLEVKERWRVSTLLDQWV